VELVRKVRREFITSGDFPAATLVGLTALADPRWLVEVEAVAGLKWLG